MRPNRTPPGRRAQSRLCGIAPSGKGRSWAAGCPTCRHEPGRAGAGRAALHQEAWLVPFVAWALGERPADGGQAGQRDRQGTGTPPPPDSWGRTGPHLRDRRQEGKEPHEIQMLSPSGPAREPRPEPTKGSERQRRARGPSTGSSHRGTVTDIASDRHPPGPVFTGEVRLPGPRPVGLHVVAQEETVGGLAFPWHRGAPHPLQGRAAARCPHQAAAGSPRGIWELR